jgi:hypothetical protein
MIMDDWEAKMWKAFAQSRAAVNKFMDKKLEEHDAAWQKVLDRVRREVPEEQQGLYLAWLQQLTQAMFQQVVQAILSGQALPWPSASTDNSLEYGGPLKYKFGEARKQAEVFEAEQRKRDEEFRQQMKREEEDREAELARDQTLWEKRRAEEARDEAERAERRAQD